MFFFFFGDVKPQVRKVIESEAAVCPRCSSVASLVEYDTVFRAFFFPVWRWSGANPAVYCESCSFLQSLDRFQQRHPSRPRLPAPDPSPALPPPPPPTPQDFGPSAPLLRCWSCTTLLQPEYRFCPQCGVSQPQ